MCLSVVCENLLYFRVELDAVFSTCLCYDLPASERLDGSLEEFVSLETYDKFVLFVDITGCV